MDILVMVLDIVFAYVRERTGGISNNKTNIIIVDRFLDVKTVNKFICYVIPNDICYPSSSYFT